MQIIVKVNIFGSDERRKTIRPTVKHGGGSVRSLEVSSGFWCRKPNVVMGKYALIDILKESAQKLETLCQVINGMAAL